MALRASAGSSLTLGRDSFISANGLYSRDRIENRSSYGARVSGGTALSHSLALVGELEWDKSRDRSGGVVRIGIRQRIGSRASARADVDSRGVMRASYQNSGGAGIGAWSGSIDVNRNRDGADLNAQGTLVTNRFELGLSQFGGYSNGGRNISDARTSLRVGTSIAFADGAVAVGRPIQQAFLIAEPHRSLAGKQVSVDPQERSAQARSGTLGGALNGNLSAYSPRTLVYEVPEAPPGYDLGAGNVQIVPPYKGGFRLEIGSDYHLLVIGRLLGREGKPVTLLAGRAIDLGAPDPQATTLFTTRGGRLLWPAYGPASGGSRCRLSASRRFTKSISRTIRAGPCASATSSRSKGVCNEELDHSGGRARDVASGERKSGGGLRYRDL